MPSPGVMMEFEIKFNFSEILGGAANPSAPHTP